MGGREAADQSLVFVSTFCGNPKSMPLDSSQLGMSPGPSSVAPSMTIMRALNACPLDDDIVDLITFAPSSSPFGQ
jgi:hypothetical protein